MDYPATPQCYNVNPHEGYVVRHLASPARRQSLRGRTCQGVDMGVFRMLLWLPGCDIQSPEEIPGRLGSAGPPPGRTDILRADAAVKEKYAVCSYGRKSDVPTDINHVVTCLEQTDSWSSRTFPTETAECSESPRSSFAEKDGPSILNAFSVSVGNEQ